MTKFIHKHKKTIFWIIFIGIILSTFAYFGVSGYVTKDADTVAIVNSVKISYTKYNMNVNKAFSSQREQKKDSELTAEEQKQIRINVLQSMISEEAFSQAANKYRLKVTDDEVIAYLQQIPAFQKNGKFDHKTYFQILQYGLNTTPEEFEESRRTALLTDRLKFIISLLSKVTDSEARSEYLRRNGNMKNWETEKGKFIETLTGEKGNYFFGQWGSQLQQQTQIKEYLSKFEKFQ